MRKLIRWTLAPMAIVALACGKDGARRQTAMRDDLKRDLELATATQNIRISPDEIAPKAAQNLAVKPKKAPNGSKVIRSEKPTVKASVAPVEAAAVAEQPMPEMQVVATAPTPSETPAPDAAPPLTRPGAAPVETSYPGAQPIPASSGPGAGAILGGILGAVIRGGMVGDGDLCDPRPPSRRGGRPIGGGGGSYYPSPIPMGTGHIPQMGRPRW